MSYPNPNPNRNPILGHNFIAPDTISYRNLYKILSEGGHFKFGHYYVLHKHYENPTKYKADHIIISLKTNMFTPWHSWKIAELALNNNQSLWNCESLQKMW
jgi:hypothetical protein